jgi:anti-anti-sigma factor
VKCYEITKCSEKDRAECYVWKNFGEHPEDLEDVKCWVLKGAYHEAGSHAQTCRQCKYYLALNREVNVAADKATDVALVSCSGAVNSEKTGALEKVWEAIKKHNKNKVVLDLSRVTAVYSCGLSLLVKIHKETLAAGGMMVLVVGQGQAHQILQSSKLSKILHCAADQTAARELFETATRKKEAESQAAAEKSRRAAEEERRAAEHARQAEAAAAPAPAPAQPKKKFVRCWEYWNNQNPHNATTCDECSNKLNPKPQACWVIEGNVEGVTFHFVNEGCLDCRYFEEFGKVQGA